MQNIELILLVLMIRMSCLIVKFNYNNYRGKTTWWGKKSWFPTNFPPRWEISHRWWEIGGKWWEISHRWWEIGGKWRKISHRWWEIGGKWWETVGNFSLRPYGKKLKKSGHFGKLWNSTTSDFFLEKYKNRLVCQISGHLVLFSRF